PGRAGTAAGGAGSDPDPRHEVSKGDLEDVLIEEPAAPLVEPELPATLPVLPRKETVVFPESMTPLAIGQERSVKLIDDVVGGDRLLALVTVVKEEGRVHSIA